MADAASPSTYMPQWLWISVNTWCRIDWSLCIDTAPNADDQHWLMSHATRQPYCSAATESGGPVARHCVRCHHRPYHRHRRCPRRSHICHTWGQLGPWAATHCHQSRVWRDSFVVAVDFSACDSTRSRQILSSHQHCHASIWMWYANSMWTQRCNSVPLLCLSAPISASLARRLCVALVFHLQIEKRTIDLFITFRSL